ncbi:MAG: tyrosine-type recombinase/integrase family protein, partial [Clostridia bacterium]|nr:tyrosine-type recombinase/integrase family protein [Clostridia bacterium]
RKRVTSDSKTSYQVIVESEKDPLTGKRQRQYKTVNGTKKEAEAILQRMLNELANSGAIVKPSALKLKDWLTEWLELYLPNIEETTRFNYRERITNRIIPYLGNTPIKDLKTSAIQEWVTTLHKDEELAPKSVKNIFLNLKAALDKAVILRMIPYNPCIGIELPKLVKYDAQVYDEDEIAKLLETARNTDIYLLVVLIVTIGFRRGEITALTWDDIELDKNLLHIRHNTVIAGNKKITKAPKTE